VTPLSSAEQEALGEAQRLRRCLADVIALSALPSVWAGASSEQIAESLADVLLRTLGLDCTYVTLFDGGEREPVHRVRARASPDGGLRPASVREAVETWLRADETVRALRLPVLIDEQPVTMMSVPLGYSPQVGLLVAGAERPDFPTEQDRLLLSVAANQAAVAIDNARLFRQATAELAERKRTEALLGAQKGLLEQIARGSALPEVLDALTRMVESHSEGALCSILLLDEEGRLRHGSAPSLPPSYSAALEGVRIGPSVGSCGTAAFRKQPVVVTDIAADPLWADFRDLALSHGLRACWSTPILGSDGSVRGTVAMYCREPRSPSESDAALTEVTAHLAGIAIERARTEAARRRDEEELARRANALAARDREKDEFLAMLAHELRNPLAPIITAVQVLQARGSPDPLAKRQRAVIDRQARHMARLLDDLLDVSRISRNKIELRRQTLDFGAAAEQAVEAARALIEERRHELHASIPSEPLFVTADPTRLNQVIGNLLTNAAKYTEPGGRIEVSVDREERAAVLRVADSGVGIAPEFLPRVFELFAQADRSVSRPEVGLGIGLTMVQRLVHLHGGTVEVRSEGLGRGSEFTVRWPLAAAVPEDVDAGAGETIASIVSRRLLIVDDNRDAAETLCDLATLWGHDVRTAHDGPSALEAAAAAPPEVILLDISMPGMSGYEVARRIRSTPELAGVTLIALTGYGQEQDRQRTLEAGFDHHLTKPVDPDALRQVLGGKAAAAPE
jgi:signal transduction histidine kinase/CheY-like chemotaxis protein